MMDELAFHRERALLEIIMMMRRQFCRVARALVAVEIVHHDGGAAPDTPEAARLRRHVEAVDAQAKAVLRRRPVFQQRDIGLGIGIGRGVGTFGGEIGRARGEDALDTAGLDDPDARRAGRHEGQRAAVDALRAIGGGDLHHDVGVGQQHRIFVGLLGAGKHAAGLALGIGHQKILSAAVPALAFGTVFLRRLFVEFQIFRLTERPRRHGRRGSSGRRGREFGARIIGIVHERTPSDYFVDQSRRSAPGRADCIQAAPLCGTSNCGVMRAPESRGSP